METNVEKAIGWGILGPGRIARKFAAGLAALPDARLAAVASRDGGRARAFAEEFRADRHYASYEAMFADPAVDVVYVATPHAFHLEHTLLCLDHGKHVLCEKPLALNQRQAQAMVDRAGEKKLFLMEALWTRFLPHMRKARELAESGAIGEPRLWRADFCANVDWNPGGRLFDPALGGGGLLDVGVYPLSFASFFFGDPVEIKAVARLGATGVDEVMGLTTLHAGGEVGSLACATRLHMPHVAALYGTEGAIHFSEPWWRPARLTVKRGDSPEELVPETVGNGYNYEAAEVHRCLREGLLESPAMPWSESLALLRTMDEARRQVGLRYTADR